MANKVWGAVAAGVVLIGAGFATSIVSAPSTAVAQDETDTAEQDGPIPRIMGFLDEVLGDLVGDGTITQDQADAISSAAEEKAGEVRDEMKAQHELLRSLLEDGVLTKEEAAQLPDDHFLLSDRFDEAWQDGELTMDEIGGAGHRFGRGLFGKGLRFGALLDDGGIDQEEYDSLPDDSPLKKLDLSDALSDGLITPDELRDAMHGFWSSRSDTSA